MNTLTRTPGSYRLPQPETNPTTRSPESLWRRVLALEAR
jgi:hypothetical protein